MMKIKDNFIKTTKKIKHMLNKRKNRADDKEVKLVGFRLLEVLVLISIATIIGVFSGGFVTYNFFKGTEVTQKNNSKYVDEFAEAFQNIIDNYYQDVDENKLIDAAIDGMLSTLDDYTSYMDEETTKQFEERMHGEYQGIGIEFITDVGYVHKIVNVFEGSPAEVAGVLKNDFIIKVDNIDASTKTGTEIANYIKGKSTPDIKLIVKRNDEEITLNINKKLIQLPSVIKKTFDKNGKKIGYLKISLFAENTYKQLKEALTSLENDGIVSLIIDVRNNSGGYLHSADDILELFLAKNDILYKMEDQNGIMTFTDKTSEKRTYPISILINGNSASASEILASAMNEVYGSELIGVTSFGKGTVQQPNNLSNGGMMKITTDRWLTPKGNWIEKVGVKPTVEVMQTETYYNNPTDENDAQLQKALEIMAQ